MYIVVKFVRSFILTLETLNLTKGYLDFTFRQKMVICNEYLNPAILSIACCYQ